MRIWDCGCLDCGHEFKIIDSYQPLECEECGSDQLVVHDLGRAYD